MPWWEDVISWFGVVCSFVVAPRQNHTSGEGRSSQAVVRIPVIEKTATLSVTMQLVTRCTCRGIHKIENSCLVDFSMVLFPAATICCFQPHFVTVQATEQTFRRCDQTHLPKHIVTISILTARSLFVFGITIRR